MDSPARSSAAVAVFSVGGTAGFETAVNVFFPNLDDPVGTVEADESAGLEVPVDTAEADEAAGLKVPVDTVEADDSAGLDDPVESGFLYFFGTPS